MKGFGVIEPGKSGWMEMEKPVAGYNDAILRPLMVAPCSSDTHIMHGGSGPICNTILGHEVVGKALFYRKEEQTMLMMVMDLQVGSNSSSANRVYSQNIFL